MCFSPTIIPKEKNHYYYIDLIRIISFLSIIMIHVSAAPFGHYGEISYRSWFVSMAFSYSVRFATPMFIMISGYLLLNSFDCCDPKKFYQKRVQKLLLPLIFWNIFYFVFDALIESGPFNFRSFIRELTSNGTYYHLYFLNLITGLYLISPFLKKLINRGLNLNLVVPLLLLLSYAYHIASTFLSLPGLNTLPTWFLLYVGYYLAGIWVSQWTIKRSWWMVAVTIVCITIAIIGSRFLVDIFGIGDKGMILAHRLSLFTAIPALLIFYLLMGIGNDFFANFKRVKVQNIANISMGIYLVHPFFVSLMAAVPPFSDFLINHPLRWLGTTYVLTSLASISLVSTFKKVPLLNLVI